MFNFGEQDNKEELEIKKIKEQETIQISKEIEILGKLYQNIFLLITVNSNRNTNESKTTADKKLENEKKSEAKNTIHNEESNQFNSGKKDRLKRKLIITK